MSDELCANSMRYECHGRGRIPGQGAATEPDSADAPGSSSAPSREDINNQQRDRVPSSRFSHAQLVGGEVEAGARARDAPSVEGEVEGAEVDLPALHGELAHEVL